MTRDVPPKTASHRPRGFPTAETPHSATKEGRRSKLNPQQQKEVIRLISKGQKTAADAARLFEVHPATISRLIAQARQGDK